MNARTYFTYIIILEHNFFIIIFKKFKIHEQFLCCMNIEIARAFNKIRERSYNHISFKI